MLVRCPQYAKKRNDEGFGTSLLVAFLLSRRMLHGPFDIFTPRSDVPLSESLTTLILTVRESQRANPVIEWTEQLGARLFVERDPAHVLPELSEVVAKLGWHPSCDYFASHKRTLAYTLWWLELLKRLAKSIETPWVLILEDDAEPAVAPMEHMLKRAVSSESTTDLVWLDNRNFWADFIPLPTIYLGTAGTLVRTDSIPRIIQCFKFDHSYCAAGIAKPGCDTILSVCCKRGHIKCHTRPYIRESGVVSILKPPTSKITEAQFH
jgi:hypothetical protein